MLPHPPRCFDQTHEGSGVAVEARSCKSCTTKCTRPCWSGSVSFRVFSCKASRRGLVACIREASGRRSIHMRTPNRRSSVSTYVQVRFPSTCVRGARNGSPESGRGFNMKIHLLVSYLVPKTHSCRICSGTYALLGLTDATNEWNPSTINSLKPTSAHGPSRCCGEFAMTLSAMTKDLPL